MCALPCLAHISTLLLKDIAKIYWIDKVLTQTKEVALFFRSLFIKYSAKSPVNDFFFGSEKRRRRVSLEYPNFQKKNTLSIPPPSYPRIRILCQSSGASTQPFRPVPGPKSKTNKDSFWRNAMPGVQLILPLRCTINSTFAVQKP